MKSRLRQRKTFFGSLLVSLVLGVAPAGAQDVIPMAEIQADVAGFTGQVVTVEGQVYVSSNYRGATISGYIQDGSGRGINPFGSGADVPNLRNTGNVVRVTGEVALFFTTVELTNITQVTLVTSGNPPLVPTTLGTGTAASTDWEGTSIQVTGPIVAKATGGPGINYTVDDGTGPIVVRVVDTIGATEFNVGQTITGRGAGAQFQSDFQVLVGAAEHVFVDPGGADTLPPGLVGAWPPATSTLRVTFTEEIDPTTGGMPSAYQVFETAVPANTIGVSAVGVSDARATLTLAASLGSATDYTVRVGSVQDRNGNAIPSPVEFMFRTGGGDTTPPTVVAVSSLDPMRVDVTFSEAVAQATAEATANYEVFETAATTNTVAVASASLSGDATVVSLNLGASLVGGRSYTVRVANVEDTTGNPMPAPQETSFTPSFTQAIPIADIQADPDAFVDQVVTVAGQIYIPTNYRGTTTSGYIQDDSGRGINLFGTGADDPLLRDTGNVVQVTGTVVLFFTTVEISDLTEVALVSGGNAPRVPTVLETGVAASSDWEGTYIETTGEIVNAATGGPGTNYTVNDGSGPIVIRVVDVLGAPSFEVGQTLTGRGAGAQFQSDFQVLVGAADAVTLGAPPPAVESLELDGPAFTFLPRLGESYPIRFTVPTTLVSGHVLLRVFDLTGRLHKTLFDSRFDSTNSRVTRRWDGRNDRAELVPPGTYVVHLVVTETQTGARHESTMPVVVSTRLDR